MDSRIVKCFSEALGIDEQSVVPSLEYNSIPEWDSVAHMGLAAALEDEFDIMLDTDDIIDMSSVSESIEIIKKYDIDLKNA